MPYVVPILLCFTSVQAMATSHTIFSVIFRNVAGAALTVVGLTLFANVPAHAGDLQQQ